VLRSVTVRIDDDEPEPHSVHDFDCGVGSMRPRLVASRLCARSQRSPKAPEAVTDDRPLAASSPTMRHWCGTVMGDGNSDRC
jgi:hypothetical protein